MSHFDIIVIGAGPGGYTAAIRAAQQGQKVALIEKDSPGGVCLNWGCIPSKNLIHQAGQFASLSAMEAVGVKVDRSSLDYQQVHNQSRDVVKTLTQGVKHLLKKNQVTLIQGTARLSAKNKVTVNDNTDYSARHILLATGSRPLQLKGFECDEKTVLSSTGILALTELPQSLVILGGGAIGCEFAYVMNSFGVKVTLVEALPQLLPAEDSEICELLEEQFKRAGIKVLTATRAKSLKKQKNQITIQLEGGQKPEKFNTDKALVVFGRTPNTESLGLETVGIQTDDRGYIPVDSHGQTSVPGIYAIGDITATPALAHVATREGEIAVNHMLGNSHSPTLDSHSIPSAIYCEPQVASFGYREQDLQASNIAYKKSVFNYSGAGKSIAVGKPEGVIKVLCDKQTGEVLGGHILGHNATELIHQLLLVKNSELLPEDVTAMIHAHPTLSEGIAEAMAGIVGKPIHG